MAQLVLPRQKLQSRDEFFLDPNLVLYLPLYKLDGASFVSRDHYGHLATAFGAVWTPQGRRWDAAGDDYINTDSALPSLVTTTKGTWMAWVKLDDATPATYHIAISFGDTDALEHILLGIFQTTGLLYAQVYDAGVKPWGLQTDAAALSDGNYAHIALIQNGTAPILLVNGVQVAQTFTAETDKTAWFSVCTGLDNGRIGCINNNSGGNTNYTRNGNVREVILSNRNYSIPEVQNYIQATKWRY